jgi:deazaflavin-dependent oxidoreductase (nitroreductase family)
MTTTAALPPVDAPDTAKRNAAASPERPPAGPQSSSTRSYRHSFPRRIANVVIGSLLRLGVPLGETTLLTVRGRTSGQPRTTPVDVIEDGGRRWLVAPYGSVNWVRNLRVAGSLTLSRGRWFKTLSAVEVSPVEAAPILKLYATRVPITRPFFDAAPDAPIQAFEAEASRHPVFRLQ